MVSIIILSYNTKELLLSCISSVKEHFKADAYEIIVVDNASSDDSVQAIKKTFPKIQLIENKENVGFAKGANIGAKKASGEYLLFLNSDTYITDDFLPGVIERMSKDLSVGAIGLRLKNKSGTTELSYGKFYTFQTLFQLLFLPKKAGVVNDTIEVDWVSGGCLFTRRDLFSKLGGFDEKLFMYVEDLEICYRIKQLGYKVLYMPKMSIIHMGQGSSNRSFAITHIYKGIAHFYKKHKSNEFWYAKLLLSFKGNVSIIIGKLTRNDYLVTTYSQAIKNI